MKKYFITYKDGYFVFPYVANSPRVIIEGLSNMPFNTHYKDQNTIRTSKNIFVKGALYYAEVEKGLWVVLSNQIYYKNIINKPIYDPSIPANYYRLIQHVRTLPFKGKLPLLGETAVEDKAWVFNKPGADYTNRQHKGNSGRYFFIHFTEEWLSKNLDSEKLFADSKIRDFISSDANTLYLPNLNFDNNLSEYIIHLLLEKEEDSYIDVLHLRIKTLELMASFMTHNSQGNIVENSELIENTDSLGLKVKNILISHIYESFPGIDSIAQQAGVSNTKLKEYFKKTYGITLLQFFKERQMKMAKTVLLKEKPLIKSLAYMFGYESAGKFSIAYKKHHGYLPSEEKNN